MTQSLLSLPTELLLLILKQLATIKDAHHLSQCCLQVNRLFTTPAYRRDIVRSIADVPSRPEYRLDAAFSVLLQLGPCRWRIPGEKPTTTILISVEWDGATHWRRKWDVAALRRRDKELTFKAALDKFLIQFDELDLDRWVKPTFTERSLGNASRRQQRILRDVEESKQAITDLFTENTVIALALHCLFVLQEISMVDAGSPCQTEEEIFKDGSPVELFDTDDDSGSGPTLPNVTLDRQEKESRVQPSSGKGQGCLDIVRLPNVLTQISRLSLSLLDKQDPRDWPTILYVLLLLSRIRRVLHPDQPWMKKVRVAGNAITPLFEDVARYFYVCTEGGFVLSPRWSEERYAALVGRCRVTVKQGHILRKLWVHNYAPVQIAEWDNNEKYRGLDGFANKVEFFATGRDRVDVVAR